MVQSHAYMFVPGWNNEILAQACSSAPCTRSSAWSRFRQSEMAKARSLGIAATRGSRTDGSRVMGVDLPHDAVREASEQRLPSRVQRSDVVLLRDRRARK